jgi:3'-phosphoadenosine 5'-phosphosulfate sulfotransferase
MKTKFRNLNKYVLILFVLPFVFGFGLHKYYISIYQIDYISNKKRVEITARIFADDLNNALEKKYNKTSYLGSDKETPEDLVLLKKYFAEKFVVKINGQNKKVQFLFKELETNVVICYLKIENISKISNFELNNSILLETNSEQQNLIQYNINTKKGSLVFTTDNFNQKLN